MDFFLFSKARGRREIRGDVNEVRGTRWRWYKGFYGLPCVCLSSDEVFFFRLRWQLVIATAQLFVQNLRIVRLMEFHRFTLFKTDHFN